MYSIKLYNGSTRKYIHSYKFDINIVHFLVKSKHAIELVNYKAAPVYII